MKKTILTALLLILPAPAFGGALVDAAEKAEAAMEAGKFSGALSALGDGVAIVWDKSPLTINKAILVASDPLGFGAYDIRDDNRYKATDDIVIYTEPAGFAYGKDGQIYTINMALDFDIKSSSGESLASQQDFAAWQLRSRVQNREFMGKITYHFNGISPGDYVVTTTVRDKNSDKSVSFDTPFIIVE